jgi:diaminopimelate epimerase
MTIMPFMKFTKMQGAGNDYVYVNGFEEKVENAPELARRMADRHFGVGGDGLIIVRPPQGHGSDCRMEMYNADGSRAQMCGNGVRCVAKYAHDHGMAPRDEIRIDTDAGVKLVKVRTGRDGKVTEAEVDMGSPILPRARIPMRDGGDPGSPAVSVPLEILGHAFRVTAVSMGNPHCVIRADLQDPRTLESIRRRDGKKLSELSLAEWPLDEIGPLFENHPFFPERVNTEFIVCRSK